MEAGLGSLPVRWKMRVSNIIRFFPEIIIYFFKVLCLTSGKVAIQQN